MKIRPIELLAPAKNAEVGIEAIKHGADAIYIGAPSFSARSAAGNTIEEIGRVVDFAHLYHAKVYVAFNTLIYDDEVSQAEELIGQLYAIGVDALIIQDLGILRMNIPPIPMHASTQADNRTVERVQQFARMGIEQIVLARELNCQEIGAIVQQVPNARLEVFVHGALCNGISGQCYLSQSLKKRSANRGNCAQICRLPFDLMDSSGQKIITKKHLLSAKDLNRSDQLLDLLEAGVSSFKIEGRLKEMSYVKNITAYYRQLLDRLFAQHPEYCSSSSCSNYQFTFTPNPEESFNRGFTDLRSYDNTLSIHSPKSMGAPIGVVKSVGKRELVVAGVVSLTNGDGLCFVNEKGELEGFRINRAEGNRLFTTESVAAKPKTPLFRNYNHEFERLLSRPSCERKIAIEVVLSENRFGFHLTATDQASHIASVSFPMDKEEARSSQREGLERTLAKLGDTPFVLSSFRVEWSQEYFIPASTVAQWRRALIERLVSVRQIALHRPCFRAKIEPQGAEFATSYLSNIANDHAATVYRMLGATTVERAFELEERQDVTLLFSKHCLKNYLGYCPKRSAERMPYCEPLLLQSGEIELQLEFDCKECVMKIKRG